MLSRFNDTHPFNSRPAHQRQNTHDCVIAALDFANRAQKHPK
jgi:hypothetical protein